MERLPEFLDLLPTQELWFAKLLTTFLVFFFSFFPENNSLSPLSLWLISPFSILLFLQLPLKKVNFTFRTGEAESRIYPLLRRPWRDSLALFSVQQAQPARARCQPLLHSDKCRLKVPFPFMQLSQCPHPLLIWATQATLPCFGQKMLFL